MIRKANENDIEKINLLGETLHDNFSKTYHIQTELDNSLAVIYVNIQNKKVVGYLYALNFLDNIDLLSIVIDKDERHKGYALELINELIKLAKDKTVTLEVESNNIKAINLYHKLGFQDVGLRKKYYKNNSAIIMKWGIK